MEMAMSLGRLYLAFIPVAAGVALIAAESQPSEALRASDTTKLKTLLDKGTDPNATNKTGATALMWAMPDLANARLLIAASYPRSMPVLQLLLDHGADIHAKDRLGVHALGRATPSADVDVVRFLVEHGCDPNEPGYGGNVRYARQYLPTLEYVF